MSINTERQLCVKRLHEPLSRVRSGLGNANRIQSRVAPKVSVGGTVLRGQPWWLSHATAATARVSDLSLEQVP